MTRPRPPIVSTVDDAFELFRWLSTLDRVSFDTETSGLDLYDPSFKVRLIQFGTADKAWVVPFQEWRGLVADIFARFDGELVAHNSRYDVSALAREGVEVPLTRLHDTMIMLRLAEPTESAGLKESASRHVASGVAAAQRELHEGMRKAGWGWDDVPIDFPPFVFYAAMDAILTARLYDTDVALRGRSSPVYELELETRAACNHMERRGMRVDVDRAREAAKTLRNKSEIFKAGVFGAHGIRVTSTEELGRFFLSSVDARRVMTRTTPGGRPSVDKETLEAIRAVGGTPGDVADIALRVRKFDKLASTYFDNFAEMADADGMIHPQIETIAARTGRMSVRDPALQTLPARGTDPDAQIVRKCVIPRQDDHVVVSVDAAQIELRLIAALSGDTGLIDAFHEADYGGVDFFTTSARAVYGDPLLVKSDGRRDTVKTFWYASAYGAGVDKMAISAGVPVEAMRDVRAGIMEEYPGFYRFMGENEASARASGGYVDTAYGRRLKVDEGKEYVATNYRIQGTAADVMKRMIVKLAQAGFDEHMLVPVHDEMVLSLPKDDVEELCREIEINMSCFDFPVPLRVESGWGANWGEAK